MESSEPLESPAILSGTATQAEEFEVSILMPCLNEAETLMDCIEEALSAIKECEVAGEVVIADNGSTDGSREIAKNAGARVIAVPNKGYGNALIGGVNGSKGRFVLMGDADGSYDFGELSKFLRLLREGYDLVMGCRLPKGGGQIEPGAMPWKHRWIGNPILSSIGKFCFTSSVDDFHCGLRAFSRRAIQKLNLRCTGMEFASEMVVKSVVGNLRIGQVPITLRPDGRNRPPHLNSWRDGWRHLKFLLLFSPKWLFMAPGIFLFLLGLCGFLFLSGGPVKIGEVNFDTNTLLLCSASLILGFQITFFAVLTKAFAIQSGILPRDRRIDRILNSSPVEWGVLLGCALFVSGAALFIFAFLQWKATGFGPLSYAESLRIVIPAITLMTLGMQSASSGFVLGLFELTKNSR